MKTSMVRPLSGDRAHVGRDSSTVFNLGNYVINASIYFRKIRQFPSEPERKDGMEPSRLIAWLHDLLVENMQFYHALILQRYF